MQYLKNINKQIQNEEVSSTECQQNAGKHSKEIDFIKSLLEKIPDNPFDDTVAPNVSQVDRNVFHIDVGDLSSDEAKVAINKIKQEIHKGAVEAREAKITTTTLSETPKISNISESPLSPEWNDWKNKWS